MLRFLRSLPRDFKERWRAVRQYGPAVAQECDVAMSRQLIQLGLLGIRYGTSPEDYYRFRMYRIGTHEAAKFLPLDANIDRRQWIYRRLSIKREPLSDKRLFYRRCAAAGLPVAETVAELEGGEIRWWLDGGLPSCDLFVKEGAALCGAGAARWDLSGDGHWSGADGRRVNEAGLIDEMRQQSRGAMMIVQRRLENHPDLIRFGPNGLCTVRVVTIRSPDDATPQLLLAVFRMPTGDNVADNFARGGLACPIELATGVLGMAVYKDLSLAHIDVSRHPDSGAMIRGAHLPCWEEVIALALRAHQHFEEFPSVGWDIAIAPQGPVLVEGNYNWDVVLAQQAGCRPLNTPRFVEHHRAWHQLAAAQV